jgi:hypothetical protein
VLLHINGKFTMGKLKSYLRNMSAINDIMKFTRTNQTTSDTGNTIWYDMPYYMDYETNYEKKD